MKFASSQKRKQKTIINGFLYVFQKDLANESCKALEIIHHKNINRLIFAKPNMSSLWNTLDSQQHVIYKNIDVMLISETKIYSLFPSVQFHLEGYATPYRLEGIYYRASDIRNPS